MKNILGNVITLTVFGESHGPYIGGVIDGLPAGLKVDMEYIMKELDKRKSVSALSTPRREADIPEFISGVRPAAEDAEAARALPQYVTEGSPVAFLIRNGNTRSGDYDKLRGIALPGHADYTAEMKYDGHQDARGGGHFSGRLTAVMVAAGAILKQALEAKGIVIGSHIADLNGITDRSFVTFASVHTDAPADTTSACRNASSDTPTDTASSNTPTDAPTDANSGTIAMAGGTLADDLAKVNKMSFAVLDDVAGEAMQNRILAAREDRDSVGGILETAVTGLEPGIGEPLFSSIESELAKAVFSVGGVKGIEFGAGFGLAHMTGSEANDPFRIEDGKVVTTTNNNGGINGGISNGMPIIFRTVIKPTPSIGKVQDTVDFRTMENVRLEIGGRHDPAIIHRARVVIDSLTAFVLADLLCQRHGSDWLI